MRTEDIIKALELCNSDEGCITCPYKETDDCVSEIIEDALNLIERLYKELNETAKEQYINGRIDGVKAFVEKLKSKDGNEFITSWTEAMDVCFGFDNESYENFINSIVKEINLLEEITRD